MERGEDVSKENDGFEAVRRRRGRLTFALVGNFRQRLEPLVR